MNCENCGKIGTWLVAFETAGEANIYCAGCRWRLKDGESVTVDNEEHVRVWNRLAGDWVASRRS